MTAFSQLLLLALISRSASECAVGGGTCAASGPAASMNLLQVGMELRSLRPNLDKKFPPTNKSGQMQDWHATAFDRYPTIFKGLKDLLQERGAKLKLLSFGCSDGRECHTLRTYFPNATIDGVDISSDLIAKNKAKNTDPDIHFYDNASDLPAKAYDAVLAMGVLCHQGHGDNETKNNHLEFSKYVGAIDMLDGLLKPGGFMVVYNADYPFSQYPRHSRFQNMCTSSCSDHRVVSADTKGLNASLINATQGMCSTTDKFCIEGGWGHKFNKAGDEIQEEEIDIKTGQTLSQGCKHAGPFFKKLSSCSHRASILLVMVLWLSASNIPWEQAED